MAELERLMQNLYEDKCTGTIPQTVFQTLTRKYETERAEKAAAIPELEQIYYSTGSSTSIMSSSSGASVTISLVDLDQRDRSSADIAKQLRHDLPDETTRLHLMLIFCLRFVSADSERETAAIITRRLRVWP